MERRQSCAGGACAQLQQCVEAWGCCGACLLNAMGHWPWSCLAQGHQVLHKWLLSFLGFMTSKTRVEVSAVPKRVISTWGKWSESAQRGGKVHRPSSQDLSPARLLWVKQCSPLRLYKCTFPSCSSAWRFLGWVTCEHLGSPCLISFPGNQHGALLLSKNSPEHSDLQFFIRNSVGYQWAGDSCRKQLKENQSAVLGDLGPPSPEGHLLNIKEITLWLSLSFCWSICLAFANQLKALTLQQAAEVLHRTQAWSSPSFFPLNFQSANIGKRVQKWR